MLMRIAIVALVAALSLLAEPSQANESTFTQQYQAGQLVQSLDLSGDQEAMRNLTGISTTMLLASQNALPNQNPLSISLSNANMGYSIGGSGQFVLIQDSTVGGSGNARVVDSCPLQQLTIPANAGPGVRTDLLSIQYNQTLTNGHSVAFSNGTPKVVYDALEGCQYNYTAGTTAPPSGYIAFATIAVPVGATSSSQATVTYLFKTVSQLLALEIGNFVTALNPGSNIAITGTPNVPVVGVIANPSFTSVSANQFTSGNSSFTSNGATFGGNVYSTNGVFAAGAGAPIQLCPSGNCALSAYVDTSGNFHSNVGSVSAPSGFVEGGGAPGAGPDLHSDGTNQYLETNGAGTIWLRPNGYSIGTNAASLSSSGLFTAPSLASGSLNTGAGPASFGYSVNTQGNYYAGVGANACLWANSSGASGICVSPAGNGTVSHDFSVPGTLSAGVVSGSGAGLSAHTIPNTSLVTTPVTGFVNGPGISVTGLPATPTVSNIGVTSLAGIGNLSTTGNTGGINISSNLLYDSNSGVYRPTGIICAGSAITNSAGQATVGCGGHIYGATATLFDASYGNFFWLRVQAISGNAVTFGVGNQNGTPQGAGVGFFYTISSYF